eukprot:TRINITY_DN9836_c0_g2_i1.p1 TRINITY_DN9836_c0_g2~~TRINITY_DN9836_c0_g2_i1.p1  ORF type:complete len:653 (-),score=158.56 TRINITY_DN9836_c0_g2_i1:89-2047(-)
MRYLFPLYVLIESVSGIRCVDEGDYEETSAADVLPSGDTAADFAAGAGDRDPEAASGYGHRKPWLDPVFQSLESKFGLDNVPETPRPPPREASSAEAAEAADLGAVGQMMQEAVTAAVANAGKFTDIPCCRCPAVDCAAVNEATEQLRDALERVAPRAWFLLEGTMIGALRFGENCHMLQSGKKAFADSDMDVCVIVSGKDKKDAIAQEIWKILEPSNWTKPTKGDSGIWSLISTPRIPKASCTDSSLQTVDFHVDIHYLFQEGERLTPDPGYSRIWSNFFFSRKSEELPSDVILPLRQCRWGKGTAYVPNQYIRVLTHWSSTDDTPGEYGSCDTLWRPLEEKLATADNFACRCELSEADDKEIRDTIKKLEANGYASLAECLPAPSMEVANDALCSPKMPLTRDWREQLVTAFILVGPRREDGQHARGPRLGGGGSLALEGLQRAVLGVAEGLELPHASIVVAFDGPPNASQPKQLKHYTKKIANFKEWKEQNPALSSMDIFESDTPKGPAQLLQAAWTRVGREVATPFVFVANDAAEVYGDIDVEFILKTLGCDSSVQSVSFYNLKDCSNNTNAQPCRPHASKRLQRSSFFTDRPHFATSQLYTSKVFPRLLPDWKGSIEELLFRRMNDAGNWIYGERQQMQHVREVFAT